jgi:hypothetical protein
MKISADLAGPGPYSAVPDVMSIRRMEPAPISTGHPRKRFLSITRSHGVKERSSMNQGWIPVRR